MNTAVGAGVYSRGPRGRGAFALFPPKGFAIARIGTAGRFCAVHGAAAQVVRQIGGGHDMQAGLAREE